MAAAPTSDSVYVAVLYIALKRFGQLMLPIFLEQVRDESPAVLLAKQSYRQIKHEHLILQNLFAQKSLLEQDVEPESVKACEEIRERINSVLTRFLNKLYQDAKNNTWVEAIAGDENTTLFSDRYYEHLSEMLSAFNAIRGLLIQLEGRYEGLDQLRWNRRWKHNVPVPTL